MKFALTIPIFSAMLAQGTDAFSSVEERALEKRSIAGVIHVDGLAHRSCPRVSKECTINGRYYDGDKVKIKCWTATKTTSVKGDK